MTETPDTDRSLSRVIFPLPGNEALAEHLARAGGWPLGTLETRRFPDGEAYVRLLDNVAGKAVDLVCTLARADEGFLRLVFAADAARALGRAFRGAAKPCSKGRGRAVRGRAVAAGWDRVRWDGYNHPSLTTPP